MSKYILFEWIVPIGFALLSAGLVTLILEILEWSSRTSDWDDSKMKSSSPKHKIT